MERVCQPIKTQESISIQTLSKPERCRTGLYAMGHSQNAIAYVARSQEGRVPSTELPQNSPLRISEYAAGKLYRKIAKYKLYTQLFRRMVPELMHSLMEEKKKNKELEARLAAYENKLFPSGEQSDPKGKDSRPSCFAVVELCGFRRSCRRRAPRRSRSR